MDGHMLDDLGLLIKALAITCAVSVPLGLWKMVEIGLWLVHHVSVQ